MKYVSTRGAAPVVDFAGAMLGGLASDGGLYVPESWPSLPAGLRRAAPYAETAAEVIWPFVDGIDRDALVSTCVEAYATFRHDAVCPLVQLSDDTWLLELFHGPTLAFKDVALQLVGRLMDDELGRRGERTSIVVATSGDTGSAAIEACRGRNNLEIFVLHPAGRVSEVQRRQMTTVVEPNVHNLALEGTFDDCQDVVKALFADAAFREAHRLGALNSINWARVVAQVVYYVTAAVSLGATETQPISFAVPSGNFGNVFSGWVAKQMGVPIHQLIVGSNRNDILTRTINYGRMETAEVVPTMSPSMDIQISSNFERLLFELNGRDGGLTTEQMGVFRASGRLALEADQLRELQATFTAASVDEQGDARSDRPHVPGLGRRRRPSHRGGVARRGGGGARCRHPRGRARDRASREVPRRRREGDRHPARVARAPRRSLRPARALRHRGERHRRAESRNHE